MIKKYFLRFTLSGVILMLAPSLPAQNLAVKTNLLYDATATINAGFETGLSPKWTLDVSGNYNGWNMSSCGCRKWKHWMVQPEARYWFCERFNGHFLAMHALGGQYNLAKVHLPFGLYPGLRNNRYEGWYAGAGVGYGYQWVLNKRWNLEAEIGVGYVYTDYKTYRCSQCPKRTDKGHKNYLGPTKAALTLVYVIN